MPIYNTNKFWNYVTNEPLGIINKCREVLTRKDYNFDTKHYDISNYYNDISSFTVEYFRYDTIRFPAGLTKYLAEKVGIAIEDCNNEEKILYTQEDVLKTAELVRQVNPKFEIRDYQIEAALQSINNFRSLIVSSTGSGKGQPVDLIIPTPNGYKEYGKLKIGDMVFNEKGKPTKIIGIFPQGIKKVYKFTFSSGKETYCDEEHLWTLSKYRNKKHKVFSTKELLLEPLYRLDNRGVKHYKYNTIQSVPVEYTPKKYDIDPYLLGVIIGDGSTTNNHISISNPDIDSDIRDKINKILKNSDYRTELDYHASCPRIAIVQKNKRIKNGFINKIKKLKLNCKSIYKFIPEEYLIGSIEQRLELLRGLMDTDGSCRKRKNNCSVSFSSSSLQLIKNVQELIFSLGGIARIQTIDKRGKNIGYTLLIQMNICPFYTSRKAKNWNPFIRNDYLKSIEYIKDTETVCIKVDSPNELYITSNYIITHNTSVMSLVTQILSHDKILIMNGNNFILNQIYERIKSFGETDISYKPSTEPDYEKRIVIMNSSLSDSRLNSQDEKYIKFLNTVNTFITDECFSGDTEILTNEGWKRFDTLTGTEEFANFKTDTREIYFTPGQLIKRFHNNKCIKLKTHRTANITMTPGHQQLYINKKNEIYKETIENMKCSNQNAVFISGKGIGKKEHLTELDKILIAIQADGCAVKRHNWSKYQICFSKERKINKWLDITKNFTGELIENKSDTRLDKMRRRWSILLEGYENKKAKHLNQCFNLKDFSEQSAKEFIEEVINWDGWIDEYGLMGYDSIDRENASFVSAVATLAGYSSFMRKKTDSRSENFKDSYRVFINNKTLKNTGSWKKEYIDYNDYVYCVEVPEHNIIVRNSGDDQFTIVTGNCHHLQSLTSFEPIFYMNPDNLRHIIGYTASPFREYKNPYRNPDDFRLIALIGEPVFKYEMKDTIADGNIAQPYAYFIRYQNKVPFIPEQFKDNYYMKYRASITYNKARNKAGFEMIKYLYNHDIITFVAFNNIKPGQKLLEQLYENNIQAVMITGDETIYRCETTKRGKIKVISEQGNPDTLKEEIKNGLKIVIGTSVLDEGVDIDLFQATVLFSAGRSPIGGLQKVGRSVRKKVNGMNVSLAIDFRDEGGLNMFKDHYLQRRELMIDSGIKVLDNVYDFLKLVEDIKNAKEE